MERRSGKTSRQTKAEQKIKSEKEFIQTYAVVFERIGCFEERCHIEVKSDVKPVLPAKRKVPFSIQERLKRKLSDMEKDNIIQVDYPTEWVSSLMIVEKPDSSLRICLRVNPRLTEPSAERH